MGCSHWLQKTQFSLWECIGLAYFQVSSARIFLLVLIMTICTVIILKIRKELHVFTALHGMQTRSSNEISVCLSVRPSVRLSVCPSVRQTRALWQNRRKICPDFYTVRKIIQSSFMRRRMVGGGRPLLSEILGQPARVGAKSLILNQ